MGTTAQKLEYLGTTKSQLKTMINYGLDDDNKITSSTTFRNYVLSIKEAFLEALRDSNTLFTNLPKKTGSGSNITLNGTAYAPMRLTLETNATTQASTPTPSSPQEVKTVTGLQEIKAVGKNLMKMSLYNANNYVSQKLTLETGEYYVSYVGDNSSAIYLRKANGTTPINGTSVKERYNGTTLQFTISEKGNYYIQCYLGGSGFTNFSQAMLNKGTTGLPYEPYQEQVSEINLGNIELCKIGTYEDKIFKTTGKNLFSSEMELGIINGSGQNEANNNAIRTKGYIAIKPETTYYLSNSSNYYQNLYYYDSNFNYVRYSETTGSFTTPSGVAYLRTRTSAGSTQNDLSTLYQLELGNQKTDYEPYSNNEWYVKKNIGKVVLDGSETWVDSGYNASAHHYTYQGANKMGGQTNLISNKFVTSTVGTLVYSCVGNASNTNITLKMPLDISTVSQMKTWLGSNITTVYFVLATPTYTKLNDTLQEELENACYGMLSYKGQTNIMVESNILPFIVNAVAIEQ